MSSDFNKQKRELVWNKYNKHCAYCGVKLEYNQMQVDHIKPIHRKSSDEFRERFNIKRDNTIDNLNPSCVSCNSSKSTFSIENWRKEIHLKVGRLRRKDATFRIAERFGLVTLKESINDVVFYFEKL